MTWAWLQTVSGGWPLGCIWVHLGSLGFTQVHFFSWFQVSPHRSTWGCMGSFPHASGSRESAWPIRQSIFSPFWQIKSPLGCTWIHFLPKRGLLFVRVRIKHGGVINISHRLSVGLKIGSGRQCHLYYSLWRSTLGSCIGQTKLEKRDILGKIIWIDSKPIGVLSLPKLWKWYVFIFRVFFIIRIMIALPKLRKWYVSSLESSLWSELTGLCESSGCWNRVSRVKKENCNIVMYQICLDNIELTFPSIVGQRTCCICPLCFGRGLWNCQQTRIA